MTPPPVTINKAKFSTKFEEPIKFAGQPLTLGIIIDPGAPAPLYFQRRYLDINRQLLETKSTLIPVEAYGKYLRLTLDDTMLPCAAFIETDITDDSTNTVGVCPDGTAGVGYGIVDDINDTFIFPLASI